MIKKATNHPRLLVVSAVLLALGLLPAIAGAAVLLYEPFDYADGNLVGNDGWANHSGSGFFIQVSGSEAVLLQGSGSREDANAPYAARGAGDKTYAAFKVTVPAAPSLGGGDYFAHFRSSADFIYPARIYVGPPNYGGDFTFGLSGTSSGTTTPIFWGFDFSFGTSHIIVASYNGADGVTQMWVDPASEVSPSISSIGAPAGDILDQYALRQGSGTTSQENVDNLVVGETFDDVFGVATPAESSTWGRIKAAYR